MNSIIKYYIEINDSTQYEWVKEKYESFGSGDKVDIIDNFAYYLLLGGVSAEDMRSAIAYFEKIGLEDENMYGRYTAFRALYRLNPVTGVKDIRQRIIANEKDEFLKGVYESWEGALK